MPVEVELDLPEVMHLLTEGETVEMEYNHQSPEQLYIMLVVVVVDHITLCLQPEVVQEVKVEVELVEQLDKIALVSLVLQIPVVVEVEHPLQEVEIKMEVQEALDCNSKIFRNSYSYWRNNNSKWRVYNSLLYSGWKL